MYYQAINIQMDLDVSNLPTDTLDSSCLEGENVQYIEYLLTSVKLRGRFPKMSSFSIFALKKYSPRNI